MLAVGERRVAAGRRTTYAPWVRTGDEIAWWGTYMERSPPGTRVSIEPGEVP
ncbi:hypothetical protein [Kribbella italica]|uniref:Uncharacterized protein n=1 Tax=Kribbella italica TaxID=1540520 RepID=A0A7W9MW10_9ACTN|nr:hypothetical protein [Kribbella italica]MBB5837558.1 hypothetical protein [Kribbella italica]